MKKKRKTVFDIESTGLEPIFNKIVCISFLDTEIEKITSFCSDNEIEILNSFWRTIEAEKPEQLVGFVTDFDVQFLIIRSLINKIKISKLPPILDLRKLIYCYDIRKLGRLRDWAFLLDFKVATQEGRQIVMLYESKNFEEIKKHCEEDCMITSNLLKRCEECNLIKSDGGIYKMELEWKEPIKIPDGEHSGEITKIEYRTDPFEYTDVFIKLSDADVGLKYGSPTVLSENSKLGRLLIVFGETFEKGKKTDPEIVLKGKKVKFMTLLKKQKDGREFSEIVTDSIKPAE